MAKKTAKQRAKTALKVLISIIIAIGIIAIITAIINLIAVKGSENLIDSIPAVEYENQLVPTIDEADGYYTFTTDEDMKVMQLTDVHIGAGMLCSKKDSMAINAIAAMISEEKPDLVIVTGDIAYPVPFQAGTFNNKNGAKLFARLMEKLGVYWCLSFGNHDTEAYSYYNRKDISELYSNKEKYPHCLFQAGPEDVDGYGNYIVKEVNSTGEIVQGYIMMDSNAYVDNDYLGIMWKYDCSHENQVEWYKNQINALTTQNANKTPKTMLFFHIPMEEVKTAYDEYANNGFKDTENAQYLFGKAGEKDAVVYCSTKNYGLFDACKELGSTHAAFFGHDHLNNFSILYKGIQLTYGYSVDYLAYSGIAKFGAQRGNTILTVHQDGTYDITQENYYQDKYQPIKTKESVSMGDFYDE